LFWRRWAGTYSDGKLYTRSKKGSNADFGVVSRLMELLRIFWLKHILTLEPINYKLFRISGENYRMWRAGTVRNSVMDIVVKNNEVQVVTQNEIRF
jgi:hypothetical protein